MKVLINWVVGVVTEERGTLERLSGGRINKE